MTSWSEPGVRTGVGRAVWSEEGLLAGPGGGGQSVCESGRTPASLDLTFENEPGCAQGPDSAGPIGRGR